MAVGVCCVGSLLALGAAGSGDYGSGVASTLHNLSASGPGEVKALDESEVCKFCHIPHNAVVPRPLWSRELSRARYTMPSVGGEGRIRDTAAQPNGSSRLCLSCHDGTIALGEIGRKPEAIAMAGAQRLGAGRRGHVGTDLSGSHPISFVVPDGNLRTLDSESDMSLKPLVAIRGDADVRLDEAGRMQCTTCHDAHADKYFEEGRVPRFWVRPTVEEVCLTCHELR